MSMTSGNDPFNLDRFVQAQTPVYARVLTELRAGSKRSHWMWFIFPQLRGLGSSTMAELYAISGRPEAAAYLAHPTLGPRLRECVGLVLGVTGRTVSQIFGYPDDLKFHSSLTLFAEVSGEPIFREALLKYFAGKLDPRTTQLLKP